MTAEKISAAKVGPYLCGPARPLLLIAGPCVIEKPELTLSIATRLKSIVEGLLHGENQPLDSPLTTFRTLARRQVATPFTFHLCVKISNLFQSSTLWRADCLWANRSVKMIQRAIHFGWPVGSLTCLRQWLTCPWPLPLSKTFLDVRDPRFSNKVRYPGVRTPAVAVCLSAAGVARFL